MIENTHDRPYLKGSVGPEIVAALAVIGHEVRRAATLPLGVQVLAGANQCALAVALACGASFVRVEGFVFAHVADEGIIESSAGSLLRYRRAIGADRIRVFADVKKKHSAHALTADVSLVETAKAAEFFLVDGVIVSGIATGHPADAVGGPIGRPSGWRADARRFRRHAEQYSRLRRRGRPHRRIVYQARWRLVRTDRRIAGPRARARLQHDLEHEGTKGTKTRRARRHEGTKTRRTVRIYFGRAGSCMRRINSSKRGSPRRLSNHGATSRNTIAKSCS